MVRVRAVAAHDELHRGDDSLVLLQGRVHRVSSLGTLLRERARRPVTLEELAAALEEALGPPPEGSALDLTRQAVDALLGAGLLERVDG